MPEYSDYLESQLTGYYNRESDLPPMADDPESFQGEQEEDEPFECPICGCNVARWTGRLGKLLHSNCRNCGYTSYREIK
jgi:hypothetical protein